MYIYICWIVNTTMYLTVLFPISVFLYCNVKINIYEYYKH